MALDEPPVWVYSKTEHTDWYQIHPHQSISLSFGVDVGGRYWRRCMVDAGRFGFHPGLALGRSWCRFWVYLGAIKGRSWADFADGFPQTRTRLRPILGVWNTSWSLDLPDLTQPDNGLHCASLGALLPDWSWTGGPPSMPDETSFFPRLALSSTVLGQFWPNMARVGPNLGVRRPDFTATILTHVLPPGSLW